MPRSVAGCLCHPHIGRLRRVAPSAPTIIRIVPPFSCIFFGTDTDHRRIGWLPACLGSSSNIRTDTEHLGLSVVNPGPKTPIQKLKLSTQRASRIQRFIVAAYAREHHPQPAVSIPSSLCGSADSRLRRPWPLVKTTASMSISRPVPIRSRISLHVRRPGRRIPFQSCVRLLRRSGCTARLQSYTPL